MTPFGRLRALIAILAVLPIPACALEKQESLEGRATEKSFEMTLGIDGYEDRQCQANISLNYWQKNTVASVESVLTNDQCGPSSGSYVVSVRYENEAGELQTEDYNETWARQVETSLEMTKEYSIGENVDLVNVRVRRLRCTCDDPLLNTESDSEKEQTNLN